MSMLVECLGRSASNIEKRIKELGLARDQKAFRSVWAQRREDATGHMAATREAYQRPAPDKTERHWRACLALGGFPVAMVMDGRTFYVFPSREPA